MIQLSSYNLNILNTMKKHNILFLLPIILFMLNSAYSHNQSIDNIVINTRQNYKSFIDTKLFESKTTSFSKSNDGTIYAGRYSYGSKLKDSSILRTTNNGQTWEKIENFPEIENAPKIFETIVKAAPNNSNNLFVYFLTESYEIFPVILISNDGGKSFEQIHIQNIIDQHDLGKLYTLDVHIDPKNENSAYFLINGMNNSKIYKYSEDKNIRLIDIDSNYFDIIISIALGQQNSDIIYAAGFSCIYKSKDAGNSWETATCSSDFDNSFKKLKVDLKDDNIVYGIPYKLNKSLKSEIIKLSTDGGYNWETKYLENYNSKEITAQGVSIDIDESNPNNALITLIIIDNNKDKENSEYQKSKIIESIDRGQSWKSHVPELGTFNIAADAIYINNKDNSLEYNVLLSSLFNLYKGKSDQEGYISNWSVIPFKYQ